MGANNNVISGGTLTASNGAGGYEMVVNQYGTGSLTIGSNIANNGSNALTLTTTGPGTTILNGTNTYTGPTYIVAGTLQVGDGTLAGTLGNNSAVTNNATLAFNGPNAGQTIGNTITGTGGVTGVGGLTTLTATNSFTGQTNLNGGTLSITSDANLGGGNGSVSVASASPYSTSVTIGTLPAGFGVGSSLLGQTVTALGTNGTNATLTLSGTANATINSATSVSYATDPTINFNGGSLQTNGTFSLAETNGTVTQNRAISLGVNGGTFNVTSGTLTVPGVISGGGTLGVSGSGTLSLTGSNNIYTGGTLITSGTLSVGVANTIPSTSAVTVNGSSAVLAMTNSDTVAGVSLQGGGTINGAGTLTSNTAYDAESGSASAILAGTVGLNKTTSGTVVLTGANQYTGATSVTGGTLVLGSGGSLAATATTVGSGATFSAQPGSGSVSSTGALTVSAGANFNMVDGSIGTFNLTGGGTQLNLNPTAGTAPNLTFEIGNLATGTDKIDVTGAVSPGSAPARSRSAPCRPTRSSRPAHTT